MIIWPNFSHSLHSQKTQQMKTKNPINLGGVASYDENQIFSFAPNNPVAGRVEKFHQRGTGHQLSDGSFEFVPEKRRRSQSTLIKKLAHGRVSVTADGFVQLTLKISLEEHVCFSKVLRAEALQAAKAVAEEESR